MLTRLKSLFGSKPDTRLAVVAMPLEVNEANLRGERNRNRLARLEVALMAETEPARLEVLQSEILRRKQFGK